MSIFLEMHFEPYGDGDCIDEFCDNNEDDYMDFLGDRKDDPPMRLLYCQKNENKYIEYYVRYSNEEHEAALAERGRGHEH